MKRLLQLNSTIVLMLVVFTCKEQTLIQDISGINELSSDKIWLSHEHVLVDFIGADSIQPNKWNHDSIIKAIRPYFDEIKKLNVDYFVDCSPNYLGRDVVLLQKIANKTGVKIITNTGFYGARGNKFIPKYAKKMPPEALSEIWINEFKNGINNTSIKPGFIKIGVDNTNPLDSIHEKLVKAAVLTHLETGLTIASHTGKAYGLWPQLEILKEMGVSNKAFIWVHAHNEEDNYNYLKAAKAGCWISLDGLGWELEKHIEKILFAKEHGILDNVLISHDAGWFDPQKQIQDIKPYSNIFTKLYPALKSKGFTEEEFKLLISINPAKAFSIKIKEL